MAGWHPRHSWLLQAGVRVLLLYMGWPLSLCTLSLFVSPKYLKFLGLTGSHLLYHPVSQGPGQFSWEGLVGICLENPL
jgi:hypothetical protein